MWYILTKAFYFSVFLAFNISFYHFLLSGFVSHQAIARTAGNVLIRLADSLVLPLNCSDYAESLEEYLNTAVTLYQQQLQAQAISMGKHWQRCFRDAGEYFLLRCTLFTIHIVMIFHGFVLCATILGQGS